jgi:hypothetical protein
MNAAKQHLESLIEERQSKIFELNRNIRELESEINAFRVAIQTLIDFPPRLLPKSVSEAHLPALSETWTRVLAFVGERDSTGASIDEIETFISSSGLGITRNNIRSQLSNYTSRGIIERLAPSRYRLAAAGYLAVGFALKANRLPNLTESIAQMYRINSKQLPKRYPSEIREPRFGDQTTTSKPAPSEMPHENQSHRHGRPYDDDDGFHRD